MVRLKFTYHVQNPMIARLLGILWVMVSYLLFKLKLKERKIYIRAWNKTLNAYCTNPKTLAIARVFGFVGEIERQLLL
jgi:hypothetical protein